MYADCSAETFSFQFKKYVSLRCVPAVLLRDATSFCFFFGPCLVQKNLQNFSDSPSHRIFRHMHEVLNIDKNKN